MSYTGFCIMSCYKKSYDMIIFIEWYMAKSVSYPISS